MSHSNDSATPAAAGMIRLRPDVTIERLDPQRFSVALQSTGERFELESHERLLLQLLTEKSTVAEVRAAYAQRFSPLEVRDVLEFIELLHGLQLLENPSTSTALPPLPSWSAEAVARAGSRRHEATGSAVVPPSPLSRGDVGGWLNSAFDLLALLAGWLSSPLMFGPLLVVVVLGANVLWRFGDDLLVQSAATVRDWHPLPLAMLVYLRVLTLLSLPTALLMGMICRQFGGRVQKFELFWWEDFLPLFRVDLGDSLAFMPRAGRRRIIVVSLLYPVALAGISLTLWQYCRTESAQDFWLLVAPPAIIASLLRWNIFADTGGYFLLCDWCDEWKIRERAQRETRAWLTFARSPAPLTHRQRYWLRIYGVGEIIYRALREALLLIGGAYLLTSWLAGVGALIFLLLVAWRYRAQWRNWFDIEGPVHDVPERW